MELIFNLGRTHRMLTCMLQRYVASSLISTQTFHRVLTASVDSWMEIKSDPSVASPILAEFGGRCRKTMFRVLLAMHCKIKYSCNNTVCQAFILQLSLSFWGKYGIPLRDAQLQRRTQLDNPLLPNMDYTTASVSYTHLTLPTKIGV